MTAHGLIWKQKYSPPPNSPPPPPPPPQKKKKQPKKNTRFPLPQTKKK